ncbi:MAG: RusA family crossover junction endodeoxyribonuclease [Candidatus Atribacteria bacterium]|nr:RusA family crossover junction endodeoxyribonuclease [Candidatus Atribacteria bacterium]
MTLHFTILGKPIAKMRAGRHGKKSYDSQEAEKERWLWEVKHQLNEQGLFTGPLKLIEGPIILRASFVMQIPKNTPKEIMNELKDGKAMWHTKKPDTKNLIAWVEDCLNKFLWEDDRQVVYIAAMKVYGLKAETQIEIEEI